LANSSRSQIFLIALSSFCLLVLASCGGSNNNRGFNSQDVGGLRVINAISDSPPLSFFIENSNFAGLAYGQSSGFTSVRDGRFDVVAAYTSLDNQTTQVYDDKVRVDEGEETTLVLAGTLAAPIEIMYQVDANTVATEAVEFHVVNTSGAGTLDVYLGAPADALGTAVASVPNNGVSTLISSTPGTRRLRITEAGSSDVLFDSGSFELAGAQRTLIHLQRFFGAGESPVVATIISNGASIGFGNQTLQAGVRIANAIGDANGVDVVLTGSDDAINLPSLPVNSISALNLLAPGEIDIAVSMETDPSTPYYTDTATLTGGQQRTLIVAGLVGDNSTTGRLALDPVRPVATAAQLNVMHGSISADRVDVYLLRDSEVPDGTVPVISNLALLGNSNLDVLAGTYDLAVTTAGVDSLLSERVSVTLNNGQIYTVLLTDAEGGGTPPQLVLGDALVE